MVDNELISQMRRIFNLNLYEAKIWAALLSRGVSTAGELSDLSGVPRSRTYDILESLEKKGFVVLKLGKPIKYMAVSPNEVLENVKKQIMKDAEERVKSLNKLKNSDFLSELKALYEKGVKYCGTLEVSAAFKGRQNIYNKLEAMIKGAKNKVEIVTTEAGMIRKVEALRNALANAKKKGVSVKIAAPVTPANIAIMKKIKSLVDVRNNKHINARFVIVDDKEIMFMLMNDDEVNPTHDIGVWVKSDMFAKALGKMFEKTWKEMDRVR